MRNLFLIAALAAFFSGCASTDEGSSKTESRAAVSASGQAPSSWNLNATIIEACSCPMFCQCYFNAQPASHPGCCPPGTDPKDAPRYCRFNNAFKVNKGSYGSTKLDGAKFWVAGDLGGDFSKGEMNWAVVHFDPAVTREQRDGITAALTHLYPVRWQSFTVGKDYPMEWTAGKDRSVAKLDGGKAAEVVLKRNEGMTADPIVIKNLRYWGAPRNEGFVLMGAEVEAYRAAEKPYEFKNSNGFMITFDINSKDVAGTKAY